MTDDQILKRMTMGIISIILLQLSFHVQQMLQVLCMWRL